MTHFWWVRAFRSVVFGTLEMIFRLRTHFAPRPVVAAALNQNVAWLRATLPTVGSLAAVGARIVP